MEAEKKTTHGVLRKICCARTQSASTAETEQMRLSAESAAWDALCIPSSCGKRRKKDEEKDENAGTFAAETASIEKETGEDIHMPVETSAPDNGRQENLRRLYEAGILSREEYLARKKKR